MKVLFITPRFPYPLIKGDRLRTYHFIKSLFKKGHEITLLSFIEKTDENLYKDELLKYCNSVDTILLPKWKSYLKMIFTISPNMPFQVSFYHSSEMKKKLKHLVFENDFDVLFFILMRMIPYATILKNIPLVMDYIDALSLNMERRYLREKGSIKKLLFYYEWNKVKKYEKKNSSIFKNIIVTSQVDRKYLKCSNIKVIPLGVDSEYFCPDEQKKDIDLIFTGNMGYFPNEDAVCFFYQEIFPFIKERLPEIKVYIVGANPSIKVRNFADNKTLFVTGYVDEVKDYLNRAYVAICPMRSGSGIQIKMLEAMACGVPVLATTYAIGGIKVKPGKEVLLANEPKEFSEKVFLLLENKQLRNEVANNARRLVKNNYNWENSAKMLEEILRNQTGGVKF